MIRRSDNAYTTPTRSASPIQGRDDCSTDGDGDGGSDDGILFGDSCERRIFFPGSNKRNTAVAENVRGSHHRAAAGTDPLSALGLFPTSPYVVLRQNAPLPESSAKEENDNNREKRSKSPTHEQPYLQRPHSREAVEILAKRSCSSIEPPWTTAAATSCHGERRTTSPYDGSSQEPTFEDIYSPQRPRRFRGRRRRPADGTQRSSYCTVSEDSFGEDESAVLLLQKIRADEKAAFDEAARLRRQADASSMIRRFWRQSG